MFFLLSKILGFFTVPSNLLIILALLGVLLLGTRFARAGRRLLIGSVIALAMIGLSPLGNLLIIPLEERFPPWNESQGGPDGIIVLGGSISADVSAARNIVALNESAERVTVVAELARRYPAARIIFTGGDASLIFKQDSEAQFAGRLFESFGVPPSRVVIEDRSRNTIENALFTKDLVNLQPGQRWLLVTSAYHMPRAMGVFRKVGFPVEAYPADWRTRGVEDAWYPFGVVSDGLRRTDTAVREWVGLVAYWLTGRSSELFPGPSTPGCDRAADTCRP